MYILEGKYTAEISSLRKKINVLTKEDLFESEKTIKEEFRAKVEQTSGTHIELTEKTVEKMENKYL